MEEDGSGSGSGTRELVGSRHAGPHRQILRDLLHPGRAHEGEEHDRRER